MGLSIGIFVRSDKSLWYINKFGLFNCLQFILVFLTDHCGFFQKCFSKPDSLFFILCIVEEFQIFTIMRNIFLQWWERTSCNLSLKIAKGQLISEWIYEVIVFSKLRTKNCQDFCPHYTGQKSWQFFVRILGDTMTS